MRGAVLYGPRDVRFGERDVPRIVKPRDPKTQSDAIDGFPQATTRPESLDPLRNYERRNRIASAR
jgi:hypothetical protein